MTEYVGSSITESPDQWNDELFADAYANRAISLGCHNMPEHLLKAWVADRGGVLNREVMLTVALPNGPGPVTLVLSQEEATVVRNSVANASSYYYTPDKHHAVLAKLNAAEALLNG